MSRKDSPPYQPDPPVEEAPTVTRMFRRLLEARPSPDGRPYKLSEIAQATQLPVAYLRDLRNGGFTMPTLDRAQRLADFFGVAPRYFLGQEEPGEQVEVQAEPDGHHRLTVRLDADNYRPLADIAHRWSVSPAELLRTIVATVLGDLEAVTPAMRQDSRLGLVTMDAVLQALMVVYERQLAAYNTEVRQDGGACVDTGGSPRGWRADGAQEQPAPQRSSRPRRGAAKGADAAGPTG